MRFRQALTTLALDFDETITVTDTISIIAQTAYSSRPPSLHIPPWSHFVEKYLKDYASVSPPSPPKPPTVPSLLSRLESYRPIEQASLSRVQSSGALSGTTRQALFEAGTKVPTQPGWASLVRSFLSQNDRKYAAHAIDGWIPRTVKIVSLNWSRDLIKGVVHGAGLDDCINDTSIIANDLEFGSDGKSTGRILGGILLGNDKAEAMMADETANGDIVYVGDSSSDVPCFLSSKIGILVRPNATVSRLCADYGIPMAPLPQDILQCQRHVVYVAQQGWSQIGEAFQ